METLEEVLALAQSNNRVCPQPRKWNELYKLLPNTRRVGHGWKPSIPLILGSWFDSSDMQKMSRLREHIEWAHDNNCLGTICQFLENLKEEEWHHLNE